MQRVFRRWYQSGLKKCTSDKEEQTGALEGPSGSRTNHCKDGTCVEKSCRLFESTDNYKAEVWQTDRAGDTGDASHQSPRGAMEKWAERVSRMRVSWGSHQGTRAEHGHDERQGKADRRTSKGGCAAVTVLVVELWCHRL